MLPLNRLCVAALATAAASHAKIIRIDAKDLAFDPESVKADPNDVLEFHFLPHNHSVALGDFDNPCMPAKSDGFFSGFLPIMKGENSQVFRVTVKDTNPMFYYCTVNGHCQGGMVGAVNPSDKAAVDDYKERAGQVESAESPAEVFGGSLEANSAPSGSTSSSSSPTSNGPSPTSNVPGAAGIVKASVGGSLGAAIVALLLSAF